MLRLKKIQALKDQHIRWTTLAYLWTAKKDHNYWMFLELSSTLICRERYKIEVGKSNTFSEILSSLLQNFENSLKAELLVKVKKMNTK